MNGKKILIIEDASDYLRLTNLIFEKAGAQVLIADDYIEGFRKIFAHHPHLIILNVMILDLNVYEICQRVREITNTPLIILTVLKNDKDILQGLKAGADYILSKPFSDELLLARANAILRRSESYKAQKAAYVYDDDHLIVDFEKHRVLVNNTQIRLTAVEFRLLVFLASNAGRVLPFSDIITNVWGNNSHRKSDLVHVYISHLRNKIEHNAKKPRYILSVHNVGYIFNGKDRATLRSNKHMSHMCKL